MNIDTVTAQYPGPSPRRSVVLGVLVGLFALGVASLVYGLRGGKSGLDFGLFTASFLYLMGISQAGVVFCAMTRLMRARWARPYYRLAELSTMAFLPFALVLFLLIYVYARDELFYWVTSTSEGHPSPWLSVRWLLIRNLFGLLLFYGLSAFYVMKSLQPDLPAGAGAPVDPRTTERQLYLLSPWVLVAFVICNTLFAWDFGMMLIPHWHSTVFPIHFWFGNLFAGTAALILFPALLGRVALRAGSDPQPRHAAHRVHAHVAVLLLGAVLRDLVRQHAARVRARVAADVRALRSLLLEHDGGLFLPALCGAHLRRSEALARGDVRHRRRYQRRDLAEQIPDRGAGVGAGRSPLRPVARRDRCARPCGRVHRDRHAARGQTTFILAVGDGAASRSRSGSHSAKTRRAQSL